MISLGKGPLDISHPGMCEFTSRKPRVRGKSLKMPAGK